MLESDFLRKIVIHKENRRLQIVIASVSILLLFGGSIWFAAGKSHNQSRHNSGIEQHKPENSALTSLLSLSPQKRTASLKAIVGDNSQKKALSSTFQDRNRARYLLAADLISHNQGGEALAYLEKLELDYPLLAPHILLKKAQAYEQIKQLPQVNQVCQSILTKYPESEVVPEAIALIREQDPTLRQLLIDKFPFHPTTHKLARQLLQKNPQQWKLLLLLAKYSREEDIDTLRDILVLKYPAKLTPEDWEAIANGYWREGEYRKAADAYSYSPPTPHNLYLVARGFHLNGNTASAKRAYQRLIREYHDAREAGLASLYLASISGGEQGLFYLEQVLNKFPEFIPNALLSQGIIYNALGNSEAADQAIKEVLEKYSDHPLVLDYRWQKARKLAESGDLRSAWQWGEAIAKTNSPESNPKAIFWLGKWAKQIGETEAGNNAFRKVITLHPQSYYAWRSAVMLGWDVGDFTTVRYLKPNLQLIQKYTSLPVDSEVLQELYFLGQYESAWGQLQSEIIDHQQLTVSEQFTEGVLLLKLGQYRLGIQQIWNLAQRETASEQEQWREIRNNSLYWYSLFPFPYQQDILSNAQQEQINPLLPISVMRKESTFDPKIDSKVGAIGLMQVIPDTAGWVAQQIKIPQYDLTKPEDNIKIGTWYLAHNHERYKNNSLLAIASYNAGTGNVNQWLNSSNIKDPDVFVENIPFQETKDYVEGVFGNYWNYLRLYDPKIRQKLSI